MVQKYNVIRKLQSCLKNGKAMIDDQLVSTNIYSNDGKIALLSDKSLAVTKA